MPWVAEPLLPARLRARPRPRPLHVVLVEPEIPPNTGNVARLCAATAAALHLVGPLGFSLEEHSLRRAGLDYWPLVELHRHERLEQAEAAARALGPASRPRTWLFTGKADRSYLDADLCAGDLLVFGRESTGLDDALLASRPDDLVGIPTLGPVRSLNLASAVAIAVYEALRRMGALELDRGPQTVI